MGDTDLVSVVAATEVRRLPLLCSSPYALPGRPLVHPALQMFLDACQPCHTCMMFSSPLPVQELKERQETPDTPEALECIPSLSLGGEQPAATGWPAICNLRGPCSMHAWNCTWQIRFALPISAALPCPALQTSPSRSPTSPQPSPRHQVRNHSCYLTIFHSHHLYLTPSPVLHLLLMWIHVFFVRA